MARILIVEPHADVRALLEHVVRRSGHVPVIPNGSDPATLPLDAAVIEPADGSGMRLARVLRARGLPVIFASIFPAEREALELEPAAYFVKPFALHQFEDTLAAAVAGDQAVV